MPNIPEENEIDYIQFTSMLLLIVLMFDTRYHIGQSLAILWFIKEKTVTYVSRVSCISLITDACQIIIMTASVVDGLESLTSNPVTSLALVRSPGDALVV
jgi:hypothetical protein